MNSFKQHCHDQRALTSLGEAAAKVAAIKEHKHILFNTRTSSEVLAYETKLMHSKAKSLPESIIANMAYESSKLVSVFSDTQTASALMFNVFSELNRLEEMLSGDADGDPDDIAKGENSGAITYSAQIKKRLKRKAVKNLQEQGAPSSAYEYEPQITNVIVEREVAKLASIAWLVKAVKQTQKSVKDMHTALKKDVSKNQAVLSKIRKSKATGNDHELLQIIAGVLGFQISGKVQDVNIK